jgi:hypothetical protein
VSEQASDRASLALLAYNVAGFSVGCSASWLYVRGNVARIAVLMLMMMSMLCCVSTLHRRDLFQRYGLDVPQTWDDYVAIATAMNGTDTDGDGVPDLWGTCLDMMPLCKIPFNAAAILAPYLQYGGTIDGLYLDPDPPGGGGLTTLVGTRRLEGAGGFKSYLRGCCTTATSWQGTAGHMRRTYTAVQSEPAGHPAHPASEHLALPSSDPACGASVSLSSKLACSWLMVYPRWAITRPQQRCCAC